MATTPTQNAVPSESPRDLKFNAGKIDEFVTSDQRSYIDRLGRSHRTIAGIDYDANQAITNYGYITKDSFEDSATLNTANEVLRWESNGEYYRWDGQFPKVVPPGSTPDSTGGMGKGKWVGVGDASLRSDLSSAGEGKGVYLVEGAAKKSGESFTGAVDTPSLTVKSRFGNLIVGDQPVGVPGAIWPLPDSLRDAVNVSRALVNTPFNCHAFSDKTVLNQGSAVDGYGAFDSTVIIYGDHHQEHAHSFQDRVSYQGSGRLDNTYGFYSAPTITGPGTVGDRRGIFVNDVAVRGGGKLEQQTGVYLEHLSTAEVNVAFLTRQASGFTFYAPNRGTLYHNGPAGFGIDLTSVPADVPLAFRGNPGTAWYGFMTTDANGSSYCVSSDVTMQFVQGGAVRAKIKPQANFQSAFTPGDDSRTPLGDAENRWSAVYAVTGAIQTSDGTEKTDPEKIEDKVLDAWGTVNIIMFQWLAMVDRKGGDSARWHFGAIAQQVRDAFIAHGLDGTKYGLLCYDKWDDEYVTHPAEYIEHPAVLSDIVDQDGTRAISKEAWSEKVKDEWEELVTPAGERWGLRPDQCAWLEAAYQRRERQRLEDRLSKLEAMLGER